MKKQVNKTNASLADDAFAEKVEAYFKENPQMTRIEISSDGYLFQSKKLAQNYADTLENKEVKTAKNPFLIEVDLDEEEDTPPSGIAAIQNITK